MRLNLVKIIHGRLFYMAVGSIILIATAKYILEAIFQEVTEVYVYSTNSLGNNENVNALRSWGYFKPDRIQLVHSIFDERVAEILTDFAYHDNIFNNEWPVPAEATVDGASIPPYLWSFVGGPYEGLYKAPSYVHDFYTDTKLRPWREVHMAFYTSMMAVGSGETKAKIMWSAVRYFGPRWRSLDEKGKCIADCDERLPRPAKFNKGWFREYVTWIERHENDDFSWSPSIFDLESIALLCDIANDGFGSTAHRRLVQDDSILTHESNPGRALAKRIGEPFADVLLGEFFEIGCPSGNLDILASEDRHQIKRLPAIQ